MSKSKFLKTLWAYVAITFGCAVYSLAWSNVFIPNGLISGGITGLCTVIQFGTGFPLSYSYGIANAILLIMGFIILGRAFGIRTIYALAIITVFLRVFPMLGIPPLILKDRILIPVIASLGEAVGIATMLRYGGSSGGTDIIALIINKFWSISLGKVYVILDIVIIASLMLIPGKTIDDMLYGYLAVIVFSVSLDYIMLGRQSSVQLLVFSDHYAEIADYINRRMDRGVTALNAVGWFSQKDRKVLLILVRRYEMSEITDRIKEVDPRAFVAVSKVTGVYGEGFEEIKKALKLTKRTRQDDIEDQ